MGDIKQLPNRHQRRRRRRRRRHCLMVKQEMNEMPRRGVLPFVRRRSSFVVVVVIRSECDANVGGKNKRDEEAKKKQKNKDWRKSNSCSRAEFEIPCLLGMDLVNETDALYFKFHTKKDVFFIYRMMLGFLSCTADLGCSPLSR
ncbi:hypothetical protein [Absidia glauca]|uniref:Uncharacterized protein n=1 Tax=Absidia glauca TaxID=4829 RepID=A0A168T6Y3_ABSGL|nr:hypothetical protein [Absidia glauca]